MKYLYSNLTDKIIGAAINVHKELGPGYPEKIYQRALAKEFGRQRIPYEREREFKIHYLDEEVGFEKMDFRVYEKIVVELKATSGISDIHIKQLFSYLRIAKIRLGLILNFGKSKLEIKRIII